MTEVGERFVKHELWLHHMLNESPLNWENQGDQKWDPTEKQKMDCANIRKMPEDTSSVYY